MYRNRIERILVRHDEFPLDPSGNYDDTLAWISQIPVQYDNLEVLKSPIGNPNLVGIEVSAYGNPEWIFRLGILWELRDIPKHYFVKTITK